MKAGMNAFFSKQLGLPGSRPSTAQSDLASARPASVTPSTASGSKATDKAAPPGTAKKGKGASEPAVPLLSSVAGQQQELTKWSNMLQTGNGVILQDAELADWLASLLKLHCNVS